jgi:multimeric flavodoxin WrbA
MSMKVVGIVGSYRKGGIIDQAVDAALAGAKARGAATEKIYLLDHRIEFCTNCRSCTQNGGPHRGTCAQNDDMASILDRIEAANGLVLGAPVNFFNVNALTRRFMERTVGYAYWPWGQGGPKMRSQAADKKAVLITSTAMPGLMGRIFTGAIRALKLTAKTVGAKPIASIFIGLIALQPRQPLPDRIIAKARRAGEKLVSFG